MKCNHIQFLKVLQAPPVSATLIEIKELRRFNNWQQYLNLDGLEVVLNVDQFECGICLLDVPAGDGVQLRDCLHSFCCECLKNVISHNEEATVCCPYRDEQYSCDSILQEREIRALVPPDVFERYLRRSIATAESQAPNSFHCKTPDCPGWCLYADNANEFLCPSCGRLNCITCRVIHEGMNCRQYQDELAVRARTDDEAKKTKEAIDQMVQKGEAMKCPSCEVIVMKKWGCDWIVCSICKVEICWVTKGPRWGPKGRGDLSGGCKCGVNGVRCHPKCNYCH
ncbi:RanBP-type and C3HC4-type zinc finger-containing protein 1 [Chamberlinius hualienensis]